MRKVCSAAENSFFVFIIFSLLTSTAQLDSAQKKNENEKGIIVYFYCYDSKEGEKKLLRKMFSCLQG